VPIPSGTESTWRVVNDILSSTLNKDLIAPRIYAPQYHLAEAILTET
jgi:hypothetical protein